MRSSHWFLLRLWVYRHVATLTSVAPTPRPRADSLALSDPTPHRRPLYKRDRRVGRQLAPGGANLRALLDALREFRWVDGRNLVMDVCCPHHRGHAAPGLLGPRQ